jgi:hypothetical protein
VDAIEETKTKVVKRNRIVDDTDYLDTIAEYLRTNGILQLKLHRL